MIPEGIDMKASRTTFALLVLCAIGSQAAHAQSALTREQVKAELADAIRTGNMIAPGDSGLRLNELNPQRYPQVAIQPGKTREEVKAELAEAIRTGDMFAAGETGLKRNEESPSRYPAVVVAAGKTREQVKAETAQAIRNGDIVAAGESGLKLNELYPASYAKARGVFTAQAPASAAASAMR
jgi:Tat protein secretion system quality control protein TatD with DNase activity